MKRIKLFLLRLSYFVDLRLGPFMVNERKHNMFVEDLMTRRKIIEDLKKEIKNC